MSEFKKLENNPKTVLPVSEDTFWYALKVLPPIYAKGCFGMGEAYTETNFYWFAEIEKRFFGFLGNQSEAETAFATFKKELIERLNEAKEIAETLATNELKQILESADIAFDASAMRLELVADVVSALENGKLQSDAVTEPNLNEFVR